jgi:hypothetical protein
LPEWPTKRLSISSRPSFLRTARQSLSVRDGLHRVEVVWRCLSDLARN